MDLKSPTYAIESSDNTTYTKQNITRTINERL